MKFTLITLSLALGLTVVAQPGALDPTFGIGGIRYTGWPLTDMICNDIAIQDDGKIILAGSSQYIFFTMVRYNQNGTIDPSFNFDGVLNETSVFPGDGAQDVIIQDDGKIIVSGIYSTGYLLARYNSNGQLDNTFGLDGFLYVNVAGSLFSQEELFLQSDGKIVIVGSYIDGDDYEFCIVRLNSDGTPDISFNSDGIVTTDFLDSSNDKAGASLIQPDGKIAIVGTCDTNGVNVGIIVSRYNSDGSLDNTFGVDGMVTNLPESHWFTPKSISFLPSGALLISGYKYNGLENDFAFVRLNSDGSLDTLFGDSGLVVLDYNNFNNVISSVIVQSNGKILVAGNTHSANGFLVMRLNPDCTPDNSFGVNGATSTLIQNESISTTIAQQTDGKILVAGYSGDNSFASFAVARYLWGDFSELEENYTPSFSLFPNPASDRFTLTVNRSIQEASIKIIDCQGRVIFDENHLNGSQFEFDLKDYSEGIYFVQINFDGVSHQLKFVKV